MERGGVWVKPDVEDKYNLILAKMKPELPSL
jgi:hypothetical protein